MKMIFKYLQAERVKDLIKGLKWQVDVINLKGDENERN